MKATNNWRYFLVILLFVLLDACGLKNVTNKNYNYPKASDDATFVYNLHSNKHRTHFFVDGQELAVGRKVKVKINKDRGHTIIAQPEGCIYKEEFVQPPYSKVAPLSFTFLMGECGKDVQQFSTHSTASPQAAKVTISSTGKTHVVVDTSPPTISITISNTSSRSGVQKTDRENVIIKGRVHDSNEISYVKLNGTPLILNNGVFEKKIKLAQGENNFILVAVDKYNNKATKPIKIQREGSTKTIRKIERTALIIGNSRYKYASKLANATNDAEDMGNKLSNLGFDVILELDVSKEQLEDSINRFGKKIEKKGGLGLFFYAGHGLQIEGNNYIIPVDANIKRKKDVKHKAVDVNQILDEMGYARNGLNVVILDACRNDPLPRSFSRSFKKGLAEVSNAPVGTLVAFATASNDTAEDGEGRNGTFTKHLLLNMKKGVSVQNLFQMVLKGVKEETDGDQVPWLSTSYTGEFKF